jgi:putative ABC transport system permease protein
VDGQEPVRTDIRMLDVDANFFEALGIPIVRGRTFNSTDTPGLRRAAVITESLARRFNSDPIGWRLLLQAGSPQETYVSVVGVAKNVGISEVGRVLDGTVFVSNSQAEGFLASTLEVRTAGPPMQHIPAIREALRRIDPNLRASQVSTETELVRQRLAPTRYIAVAWSAFGGMALLLTSIGLYGLLSHVVARRTNEIGIRMTLGARGRPPSSSQTYAARISFSGNARTSHQVTI